MQKIDISSTALEKGLDIAKGFVEKLIYQNGNAFNFRQCMDVYYSLFILNYKFQIF